MNDVRPYILWFYKGSMDEEVANDLKDNYQFRFIQIQTRSAETINEWINYYSGKLNAPIAILDKSLLIYPEDIVSIYSIQNTKIELIIPKYNGTDWNKTYEKISSFVIERSDWIPIKT